MPLVVSKTYFEESCLVVGLATSDTSRALRLAFCLLLWESENPSKAKGIHLKQAKENRMKKSMFMSQEII